MTACRETWASSLKTLRPDVDLKFFYGLGATRDPEPDVVFLNCPDGYSDLVHKTKAIIAYALDHEYDFVLKVDDDTFLSREAISALTDDPEADFVGQPGPGGVMYGMGYRLSK